MDGGTQATTDGSSAFWKAVPDTCHPQN